MWKNRDSTLFCFINESKQYHFVTKREIYIYIYIFIYIFFEKERQIKGQN